MKRKLIQSIDQFGVNPLALAAKQTLKKNQHSANRVVFVPTAAQIASARDVSFLVGNVVFEECSYPALCVIVRQFKHDHRDGNAYWKAVC